MANDDDKQKQVQEHLWYPYARIATQRLQTPPRVGPVIPMGNGMIERLHCTTHEPERWPAGEKSAWCGLPATRRRIRTAKPSPSRWMSWSKTKNPDRAVHIQGESDVTPRSGEPVVVEFQSDLIFTAKLHPRSRTAGKDEVKWKIEYDEEALLGSDDML
ncbi:hypothetical protein FVEG_07623 [Fusarium verticillioides 7600]|uniref:Uncharacterized protein n=1 Tax=Gibberella moniliformis (strain M3125 / FGSC 7600) TaxID=334819 RepID=W7M979_GIBM7|nr:hypothetical protein FVEG_07623 [Fusarium verticillioides 7600]EWG47551.1 hypothetical protein FVEG_07623 [Fusarium verticillioides 7600]